MKKLLMLLIPFVMLNTVSCSSNEEVYHADCVVTFANYDGRILYTTTVKYGEDAIYGGETPTRPSYKFKTYVFDGWDRKLTNVQKSFTTNAKYSEIIDETHPEYTNCSFNMQEVAGGYDIKTIYRCESKTKMILPDFYEDRYVVSIGYGRNGNSIYELYSSTDTGITEIKFPSHLKSIGYGSFYRYKSGPSFASLEFPDELEIIDDWAFHSISTLKSIKCNSKLKSIGKVAFFGSGNLSSLILSRNLKSIGDEAFRAAFDDHASISIYIPKSVESIGDKAFYDVHKERQSNGNYAEVPANITFYCEAESKPYGWNDKWNWYDYYQYYNKPAPAYTTHWGVPFPY